MLKPASPPENNEHKPPRSLRLDLSVDGIKQSILNHLTYTQGRLPERATPNDWYLAIAHTVRDRLVERWIRSARTYKTQQSRTVCYLSAYKMAFRHLFFIPATSTILAVASFLWRITVP